MARILLAGHAPLADQVEAWLRGWGHSVAQVASEAGLPAAGSVRRTDAIVVVCDGDGPEGCCPAALAAREDAAPMLLVGRRARVCSRADRFVELVPAPAADGRRLRRALGHCLRRTAVTRRHAAEAKIHHEYVQFLGHELRTPITSALSALEILAAEQGESTGREADFVRLALRNLKRLRETLEWTEDYLEARTAALTPRWREERLGELVTIAAGLGAPRPDLALVFEGGAEAVPVVSDASLLRGLLQQACRTLRYHAPDARVTLRISARPGAHDGEPWRDAGPERCAEVVLALHVDRPDGARGSARVSRTSLVSRDEGPQEELSRLARCTVSPEVLALLGGRLTIPATGEAGPALQIFLPAVPPDAAPLPDCVPLATVEA